MKLSDQEIKSICLNNAGSVDAETNSDEINQSRKKALDYYFGRARGDEIDGRSTAQSLDVADMINSLLSTSMPTFNSPDLVQFEAESEEDEEQARTESAHVNYVVNEKNNGYILWQTLFKDCCLSKNSTAKVWVDIKEDVESERYKGITPEEAFMALQETKPNQEIRITNLSDEKVIEALEGGEPFNLNLKRITTTRKLMITAVAPENFGVGKSQDSVYLEDSVYCFEKYYVTRSDLVEEGYDKDEVYRLPPHAADTSEESLTRDQSVNRQYENNTNKSMQLLEIKEHYIRVDRDGDGVAELLKVKTCETNLLMKKGKGDIEEVECIPYANGVIILMGHRYFGRSIYDLLKDVQDNKTHFLRQWADNALVNNHNKTDVIEDRVNMEDFLSGRPNAVRRVESLDSCREVVSQDIGPSCQLALDYFDKVRTDRSGSSLDLQSNQMTMPSNVGDQGVNTLVQNLEQVAALMVRTFCETQVKSVYKLVHKFLRLYFPEQLTAKTGGQWSQSNPEQWNERDMVNVVVPPTESEKIRQSVAIKESLMLAMQDMQQGKGGITTDESNIYQMKLDVMRLGGIDSPEKYLINPDSPQAQQAMQNAAMSQQQMQQMQMQQEEARFQQTLDVQRSEVQRNAIGDEKDREFKYTELEVKTAMDKYEAELKAEMDEAKIIGDSTTKIEVEAMKDNKVQADG